MKHIPNILSICRIIGAISLLFFLQQPEIFFPVYLLCGLSDIADGLLARRLKITSKLGARLDSIGDLFLFLVLMLYCILSFGEELYPYYPFLAVIATVRIGAIVFAAVKFHAFVILHTRWNKITGVLTFFAPIFLLLQNPAVIYPVLGIALLSAMEEFILHIISKHPDLDQKGLL